MASKLVDLRLQLRRTRVAQLLLNHQITSFCLLLLLLLVFFGTLYQTDHGLYEAQQKFFSIGTLFQSWIPMPGAKLALWILSIQLITTILLVLPLKWNKVGLWIVHIGILMLMVGGFVTDLLATESQLSLVEGETGYYTTSYNDYELAFWETKGDSNFVSAVDASYLRPGKEIEISKYGLRFTVDAYYRNALAFRMGPGQNNPYQSASGIGALEKKPLDKMAERNIPGMILNMKNNQGEKKQLLLYGAEQNAFEFQLTEEYHSKKIHMQLRLKHYPMGFSLTLLDFRKKLHPATQIPRAFESDVELHDGPIDRKVKIFMNNPLRYQDMTYFQASYAQGSMGAAEQSVFAVVDNPGRTMPYISSLTIFGGMLLHFLLSLGRFISKQRQK